MTDKAEYTINAMVMPILADLPADVDYRVVGPKAYREILGPGLDLFTRLADDLLVPEALTWDVVVVKGDFAKVVSLFRDALADDVSQKGREGNTVRFETTIGAVSTDVVTIIDGTRNDVIDPQCEDVHYRPGPMGIKYAGLCQVLADLVRKAKTLTRQRTVSRTPIANGADQILTWSVLVINLALNGLLNDDYYRKESGMLDDVLAEHLEHDRDLVTELIPLLQALENDSAVAESGYEYILTTTTRGDNEVTYRIDREGGTVFADPTVGDRMVEAHRTVILERRGGPEMVPPVFDMSAGYYAKYRKYREKYLALKRRLAH